MNIWIGLEMTEPKFESWFRLQDGKKFDTSSNQWTEYTSSKVVNGDIITMTVENNILSYKLNDIDLGRAFIDQ